MPIFCVDVLRRAIKRQQKLEELFENKRYLEASSGIAEPSNFAG